MSKKTYKTIDTPDDMPLHVPPESWIVEHYNGHSQVPQTIPLGQIVEPEPIFLSYFSAVVSGSKEQTIFLTCTLNCLYVTA